MPFINRNGKREWSEPSTYDDDPRFCVDVRYDANGIGHLDHRAAAAAWDEYEQKQEAKRG